MTTHAYRPTPWDRELAPRLSIAWFAVADILADGGWHSLERLREAVEAAGSDVLPKTVAEMLRQQIKPGILRKRCAEKGRRFYRVTEEGRRQRPELRVR